MSLTESAFSGVVIIRTFSIAPSEKEIKGQDPKCNTLISPKLFIGIRGALAAGLSPFQLPDLFNSVGNEKCAALLERSSRKKAFTSLPLCLHSLFLSHMLDMFWGWCGGVFLRVSLVRSKSTSAIGSKHLQTTVMPLQFIADTDHGSPLPLMCERPNISFHSFTVTFSGLNKDWDTSNVLLHSSVQLHCWRHCAVLYLSRQHVLMILREAVKHEKLVMNKTILPNVWQDWRTPEHLLCTHPYIMGDLKKKLIKYLHDNVKYFLLMCRMRLPCMLNIAIMLKYQDMYHSWVNLPGGLISPMVPRQI